MARGERTKKARGVAAALKEPSTWAGLGILAALFGVNLAPEQFSAVASAGAALGGVLAVFIPEPGAE